MPPKPLPKAFVAPEPAPRAGVRRRHLVVILTFLAFVVAPLAYAADYLWFRAADQYASRVGFEVRQTRSTPSGGLAGLVAFAGIPALSGSAADDGNILDEYLRSREVVAALDARLDLRRLWSKPGASVDPVFVYHGPGTIEDLHRYWQRMVHIRYDAGSRMMSVEVRAFAPGDAQAIATAIFEAAGAKINALSQIARDDTIRLASVDLSEAEARLAKARSELTAFRNRTRIVDPQASLQGQMGLVDRLDEELAQVLIEHDMLVGTTAPDDPRLARMNRRIEVIRARIEAEKAKLGRGGVSGGEAYATLLGDYEKLTVEQKFAEEAYVGARAALDRARTEARRQTRYLAAYVPPTLAERAEYPERGRLLGILAAFLVLGWTLVVVTGYSLGDRR